MRTPRTPTMPVRHTAGQQTLWLGTVVVSGLGRNRWVFDANDLAANCQANPSFVPIASGGDGAITQYWFVGFDPALAVSFRFRKSELCAHRLQSIIVGYQVRLFFSRPGPLLIVDPGHRC